MAIKLVSIDVETTGKHHGFNQIIEFGAVVDDWNHVKPIAQLPTFQSFMIHDQYVCDPYAAYLNRRIFGKLCGEAALAQGESMGTPSQVFANFYQFLLDQGFEPHYKTGAIQFVAVGKNFQAFDLKFLEETPEWTERFRPRSRTYDPAILYHDQKLDDLPPDMATCLERAGLDEMVDHRALPDALQALKLIRLKVLGSVDGQ